MAGHRRRTGRQTKRDNRITRFQAKVAGATTAEDAMDAAFDWYRSSVRRVHPDYRGDTIRAMTKLIVEAVTDIDRRTNGHYQ